MAKLLLLLSPGSDEVIVQIKVKLLDDLSIESPNYTFKSRSATHAT